MKNAADAQAGLAFAQHVLDGMFVRFEDARIEKRFDLPDFSVFPHPGGGAFHVLCRLYADNEADLWFHVSHVLQDGKPVLEAFEDLKKEWGVRGATILPAPMENTATPMIPANCDSGRDMAYVQQFLSFESLLETRKKLNERFASVLKGNITENGRGAHARIRHDQAARFSVRRRPRARLRPLSKSFKPRYRIGTSTA